MDPITLALWFGFGGLTGGAVYFLAGSFCRIPSKRFYHYIGFAICAIGSLCYMAMGMGMGKTTLDGRDVYFARYLEWILTTPLLLITLGKLAHLTNSNIFVLIVLDELMIISGLLGALQSNGWPLFVYGVLCFMPLVFFLFEDFDYGRSVNYSGTTAAKSFKHLSLYLVMSWCAYPVIWILVKMRVITFLIEIWLYTAADLIAKVVFLVYLINTEPYSVTPI